MGDAIVCRGEGVFTHGLWEAIRVQPCQVDSSLDTLRKKQKQKTGMSEPLLEGYIGG